MRVQSSSTSATGTSSATAKVRSRSEKRSPPPDGERAHGGSGDHALVLLREPEQALAESVPLLNGEHERAILGVLVGATD